MIFYLKNNLQGIEISLVFHPLIQFDAVSYNVKLMSERLLAEKTRFESFQFWFQQELKFHTLILNYKF